MSDLSLPRRRFLQSTLGAGAAALAGGCLEEAPQAGRLVKVWGRRGVGPGQLQKPRAAAVDAAGRIYLVDMTARIQCFDDEGNYLHGWSTPEHATGKPVGLGVDRQGRIVVADTHYFRVLFYTSEGELLTDRTIGGVHGERDGEFGFVTDVAQDSAGCYYVGDYNGADRIQKFSPDGEFLASWGGMGEAPGRFMRPQCLVMDADDVLWVCDACNHRIQKFSTAGELIEVWGERGTAPGKLSYPYCLELDGDGAVYVCEFGNHRVQKLTLAGESIAQWGREGRAPGQLFNPWAIARDQRGRTHILDSYNHRVQTIEL